MNIIIGANAAKLADLQIDTLEKVRSGQITLGQWEQFNNLSTEDREARFGDSNKPKPKTPAKSTEKFALLVDLGIITVPEDYVHENRLTTFAEQNRKKFKCYAAEIADRNFPNPSRVLKPSDQLRVRVFKQVVDGTTTSEERLAFLATQNAIHTGAQGLSLVFEQKRDQLPKDRWYLSFDQKDRLPAFVYHMVPRLYCDSGRGFDFGYYAFQLAWEEDHSLLCFTELES